ncbi:hypothetical protein N9A25_00190 [bacterium]|nr:hypothetical protein [bacterium]
MRLDEIAKNDKELDEVLPAIGAAAGGIARGVAKVPGAIKQGVKTVAKTVTDPKKMANLAGQTLGKAIDITNKIDQASTSSLRRTGQDMVNSADNPEFGSEEEVAAAQQDPAKKAQMKRDMQQALRDKEEQIRNIRTKMRDLG